MAEQFVKDKIKGDKVVLFIKPTCTYCVLAQEILAKYKIKAECLEKVDISDMGNMSDIQDCLLKKTGARTVPRVFIGEECVGGGSDVAALHHGDKLQGMLEKIGVLE
ncbi:glutaredoxin-1 [Parambassis ranga]|uniref:Glutaredoxin-1 n=1 Tax=Parambassis ranga TaxID=210632 RepID=A0A6P7I089_9TELE|nr:glutaredoxin-1 [Parambassis ranga]